jgi:hypothetical protein
MEKKIANCSRSFRGVRKERKKFNVLISRGTVVQRLKRNVLKKKKKRCEQSATCFSLQNIKVDLIANGNSIIIVSMITQKRKNWGCDRA